MCNRRVFLNRYRQDGDDLYYLTVIYDETLTSYINAESEQFNTVESFSIPKTKRCLNQPLIRVEKLGIPYFEMERASEWLISWNVGQPLQLTCTPK